MKIHRLDHFHIYTVDPESSARYYTEVFGAQTIGKARSSSGGAMHFLRLGGVALVLAPYPAGVEPGTPAPYRDGMYQHGFGIAHFGLHVDDLEKRSSPFVGAAARYCQSHARMPAFASRTSGRRTA